MRFVIHFYQNPSADFFKRQLDDYFHGSPFLAYKAKLGNDPRVIVYTERDDQMFLGPIENKAVLNFVATQYGVRKLTMSNSKGIK